MNLTESITAIQILIGAAVILLSLGIGRTIRKDVSEELEYKWTVTLSLMLFFFVGYLVTTAVIILDIVFPLEIITGTIFLGGACFVYLVMKLSQITISDIKEKEKHISLCARDVADRTAELEREIADRKKAEGEIKERMKELENFYDMGIGRELKMIELKKQVKELEDKLAKYEKNDNLNKDRQR